MLRKRTLILGAALVLGAAQQAPAANILLPTVDTSAWALSRPVPLTGIDWIGGQQGATADHGDIGKADIDINVYVSTQADLFSRDAATGHVLFTFGWKNDGADNDTIKKIVFDDLNDFAFLSNIRRDTHTTTPFDANPWYLKDDAADTYVGGFAEAGFGIDTATNDNHGSGVGGIRRLGGVGNGEQLGLVFRFDKLAGGLTLAEAAANIQIGIEAKIKTGGARRITTFSVEMPFAGGVAAAPVPEPGTLVLLGTGLLGLVACKRRR